MPYFTAGGQKRAVKAYFNILFKVLGVYACCFGRVVPQLFGRFVFTMYILVVNG